MTRFLPVWAPNVHPMLVHFPIALLFTGVLIEAIAYSVPGKSRSMLRDVAAVLGVLGALAALVTYMTGRSASQTVLASGTGQALIKSHWDWAFWTVSYFAALAAARIGLVVSGRVGPRALAALVVAGLFGLGLLFETADRGAELVYREGVGVGVLPNAPR